MTLHQLEIFVTVAKVGSFTQAGEKLHISQPAVSKLIQSLERKLRVELFERLGNKYRLTSAGETLLQDAEEILAKIEGIKERMDEVQGLKKGRLRVGGSALAAASFLPVAIQRFKRERPGVEVVFTIERSGKSQKKLLQGELDLAIIGLAPRSPLLIGEPCLEFEIVTIAKPNHPLTKKRSVSLELLANEPLITYREGATKR